MLSWLRRRRPSRPICIWSDPPCHRVATVAYAIGPNWPEYCAEHADEMDRVDVEITGRVCKVRA